MNLMKTVKIFLVMLFAGVLFSSCYEKTDDRIDNAISLEELISGYDLWYVDIHRTTGNGDVPFLSKAFTVSFINGKLFANNNLVGIGSTGNGYGIQIGYYDTYKGFLEVDHNLDGYFDFDIIQISNDRIKLKDNYNIQTINHLKTS